MREDDKRIKVWITKYALTQGIFELDARVHSDSMVGDGKTWEAYYHGEGKEWHRTLEDAKDKAEAMRSAKIKSLQKQIKRIEALKF